MRILSFVKKSLRCLYIMGEREALNKKIIKKDREALSTNHFKVVDETTAGSFSGKEERKGKHVRRLRKGGE